MVKRLRTPFDPVRREFAANRSRAVMNLLLGLPRGRLGLLRRAAGIDPPGRNVSHECGYPDVPNVETYRLLYARFGLATRVVDVYPNECWSQYPDVYETEEDVNTDFEAAWKKLTPRVPVLHYLHRADRLSGIGRFGIVLLGLGDGLPLDKPARGLTPKGERGRNFRPHDLLYLRPFSEDLVRVRRLNSDPNSPRFGHPEVYQVRFSVPNDGAAAAGGGPEGALEGGVVWRTVDVHWTRVVHLADNRMSSEWAGVPRMEPVLDRLLDLRKILGGSAEMFWKGAFPGYAVEVPDSLAGEIDGLDEETVAEQFDEFFNGLKRYLAFQSGTVKTLAPITADPTPHVAQQTAVIAATVGTPVRILMGSEAGHLASTQDSGHWNARVRARQLQYLEPMVVRPFLDRLILLGVLPEPARKSYIVAWPDLNTQTDTDRANVAVKTTQALMMYVTSGCEKVMPLPKFLTQVMQMSRDEAAAVEKESKAAKSWLTKDVWQKAKPAIQGGGRAGNPGGDPGRPAGQVQQN